MGAWSWSKTHVHAGYIRIEREDWQLQRASNGAIAGSILRENRFLSTDGEPFACMQGLSYSRRARYELRGSTSAEGFAFEETRVRAAPSPCEDGLRPLQEYEGHRQTDGSLLVRWSGGEQVLLASSSPGPRRQSDKVSVPMSLAGTWTWTAHESENSLERSEIERWVFEEGPDGRVRAHYRREVLVVDTSGALIACAGSDRYGYRDRYELRGTRDKGTLHMQEVAVQAGNHACIDSQRVLDAAVVKIYPEALVLEWRGRRRQVLKPSQPSRRSELQGVGSTQKKTSLLGPV